MADRLSIKDLPDASRIDDGKAYLVPGRWLKTVLAVLEQLWRGENLSRGPGVRLRQNGPAGCTISASPADVSTGGSATPLPFAVTIVDNGDNTFQAWVNEESDLLFSLLPTNKQALTGLGVDAAFNLDGDDFIWLEITFASGVITDATIKSYGMGNSWTPSASPGSTDGYVQYTSTPNGGGPGITTYAQTKARIPIAQTIADAKGKPVLRQMLIQNLMLWNTVIDIGITVQYAIPWGNRTYKDF